MFAPISFPDYLTPLVFAGPDRRTSILSPAPPD